MLARPNSEIHEIEHLNDGKSKFLVSKHSHLQIAYIKTCKFIIYYLNVECLIFYVMKQFLSGLTTC